MSAMKVAMVRNGTVQRYTTRPAAIARNSTAPYKGPTVLLRCGVRKFGDRNRTGVPMRYVDVLKATRHRPSTSSMDGSPTRYSKVALVEGNSEPRACGAPPSAGLSRQFSPRCRNTNYLRL
jgi:hypothetical protein